LSVYLNKLNKFGSITTNHSNVVNITDILKTDPK